ncbi:MAG: collagen-like protein [Actinomycetia bacterium]|nr:collagen-like protein [Actinomycetes bacterium]
MTNYLGTRLRGNPVALFSLMLVLAGGLYAAAAYGAKPPPKPSTKATKKAQTIRVAGPAGPRGATGPVGPRGAIGPAGRAGVAGPAGPTGSAGLAGAAGSAGPAGIAGSAAVQVRASSTGSVAAPHGASTSVPLSGASWTQAAGDLDLVVGSVTLQTPSACTGSFGNALVINVDGTATTFALAPTTPASTSVTLPIAVAGIMEPGASTSRTVSAALANNCTKSGEDFTVSNVKLDVVKFT